MNNNSKTTTEDDVVEWLRDNPKFLQKNPDVLDHLLPPKEKKGRGIVDFQYYMVERFRTDRDEILESTRDIVETSRINMNNLSRIHSAVLLLLEAQNFEDFIRTMTMDFSSLLNVDIVSLVIETPEGELPHIDVPGVRAAPEGTIELIMKGKDVILESDVDGLDDIFGGGSGLVKSQALLRLNILANTPMTMLAFGSRDPDLFQAGQATDLLGFLGKVIERDFRSWLGLK